MTVPNKLKELGFIEPDTTPKNRIIMAVSSQEKVGKTHFSFTGSGPFAYFAIDKGEEGVVSKFMAQGKEINMKEFHIPVKPEEAAKVWEDFEDKYYKVLRLKGVVRTMVIDTESEIYETLCLAKFGKLVEVLPWQYGLVNSIFKKIIKSALDSDKNVIFLRRMKDEYKGKDRTGKIIPAGYKGTPYDVQVAIQIVRTDPTRFDPEHHWTATITDNRFDPTMNGQEFKDELCNFPFIAAMMVPGTCPEDW